MTCEILVVEDEPDLVHTYERLLRRYDCRVTAAGSLAAGLAALARNAPQLLIADLRLPDGDGLEIVRAARALPTPAPVIVVTGVASPATRDAAMAAGAAAFLSKPFSTKAFTALVQSLLDGAPR